MSMSREGRYTSQLADIERAIKALQIVRESKFDIVTVSNLPGDLVECVDKTIDRLIRMTDTVKTSEKSQVNGATVETVAEKAKKKS